MAHLHRDCTFRSDGPRCRSRMDSIAVSAARRHGLYILDHSWRVSGWTMGRQRRCFIIGPAHPSAAIGAGWLPDRTGCFRYGQRIHHDARSAVLAGRSVAVAESVVQLRPGRLPNGQDDFLTDIAVGCKFSIGNGERGHGRGGSGAALRRDLCGEYGGCHWWGGGGPSSFYFWGRHKRGCGTVGSGCPPRRGGFRDIPELEAGPPP